MIETAPPRLLAQDQDELRAMAWLAACAEVDCDHGRVFGYVETPPAVQQAINEALGTTVTYQTAEERASMSGVRWVRFLAEGQPYEAALGAMAVNVHFGPDALGGIIKPYLFNWNGQRWTPTTPEGAGVTTTAASP
ncbi:MAG: hypothetical protein ACE5GC_08065 [Acidimicrobiia bacterium]